MRNKTTYWRFKPWVVALFLALYTLSICGITAAATWAIVTGVNSSSTGTDTDSSSDGLDGHMELRKPIIYLYPTATTSISVQLQKTRELYYDLSVVR